MRELSTIQKREKLNRVFASDEAGAGNANHEYDIYPAENFGEDSEPLAVIRFQHGARKLPDSVHGVRNPSLCTPLLWLAFTGRIIQKNSRKTSK